MRKHISDEAKRYAFSTNRAARKHVNWLARCYRVADKNNPIGLLEMGTAIAIAHVRLEGKYLALFYRKIRLVPHGTHAERLKAVGRSYPPMVPSNCWNEIDKKKRPLARRRRKIISDLEIGRSRIP